MCVVTVGIDNNSTKWFHARAVARSAMAIGAKAAISRVRKGVKGEVRVGHVTGRL